MKKKPLAEKARRINKNRIPEYFQVTPTDLLEFTLICAQSYLRIWEKQMYFLAMKNSACLGNTRSWAVRQLIRKQCPNKRCLPNCSQTLANMTEFHTCLKNIIERRHMLLVDWAKKRLRSNFVKYEVLFMRYRVPPMLIDISNQMPNSSLGQNIMQLKISIFFFIRKLSVSGTHTYFQKYYWRMHSKTEGTLRR